MVTARRHFIYLLNYNVVDYEKLFNKLNINGKL